MLRPNILYSSLVGEGVLGDVIQGCQGLSQLLLTLSHHLLCHRMSLRLFPTGIINDLLYWLWKALSPGSIPPSATTKIMAQLPPDPLCPVLYHIYWGIVRLVWASQTQADKGRGYSWVLCPTYILLSQRDLSMTQMYPNGLALLLQIWYLCCLNNWAQTVFSEMYDIWFHLHEFSFHTVGSSFLPTRSLSEKHSVENLRMT